MRSHIRLVSFLFCLRLRLRLVFTSFPALVFVLTENGNYCLGGQLANGES